MEDDPYCLPGTNLLKNKLGISDQAELQKAERLITAVRHRDLPCLSEFNLREYLSIHKTLFKDIYDWAGEPRHLLPEFDGAGTEHFKPLSEGVVNVERALSGLAAAKQRLKWATVEQFSEIVAAVFSVINQAHLFREGNGRAQRGFILKLAEFAGFPFDIQNLHGSAWNIACIADAKGDRSFLKEFIQYACQPKGQAVERKLTKTAAKDLLMRDYILLESMADTEVCAGYEYNANILVEQLVSTLALVEALKGRAQVAIPETTPRLLSSTLIGRALLIRAEEAEIEAVF